MKHQDKTWGFGRYEKDGRQIASMTNFELKNPPRRNVMIIISLLFRKAFVSPFLIDRHMGIAANTGVIRTLGSDDAIAMTSSLKGRMFSTFGPRIRAINPPITEAGRYRF